MAGRSLSKLLRSIRQKRIRRDAREGLQAAIRRSPSCNHIPFESLEQRYLLAGLVVGEMMYDESGTKNSADGGFGNVTNPGAVPSIQLAAHNWSSQHGDTSNTGRADYIVPTSRLNDTFFDDFAWQTRVPGSPIDGHIWGSSMPFFDGAGPGGSDLVVGGYGWPKGVQGMDRHTGQVFWNGLPAGGETIGVNTPAFSNDGSVIYVTNDATEHPLMAFSSDTGPGTYWHNGTDPQRDLIGTFSPKVAPDGRVFVNRWADRPYAATDHGDHLSTTWIAESGLQTGLAEFALFESVNGLRVVSGGRNGTIKSFDGATGAELWSTDTGVFTDADTTIDPANGNIYLPMGGDDIWVAGLTKDGDPLWESTTRLTFDWIDGVNNRQRAQTGGALSHDGATFYFQTESESGDGRLYAINTADGSLKWDFETHSEGGELSSASSPIVTKNGVVIVGNNLGDTYFAIRDAGTFGIMLDAIVVDPAGTAQASATLSNDGLLYLPLRLVQTVGGDQAPTLQVENLFTAIDLTESLDTTLPPDFTELNASDWESWAQDATGAVSDDTTRKLYGESSLKFVTDGGFDTYLRYPGNAMASWDLTDFSFLNMSFFAENPSPVGFQNGSPWIRLYDASGDYVQYQYYQNDGLSDTVLNQARGTWHSVQIPLDANSNEQNGWRRTLFGTPDMTAIGAIEVHADTWDFGFTLWVDGVSFTTPVLLKVTTTADSGPGSLREAIALANTLPEPVEIQFAIPTSDPGFVDVDASLPGGDADRDVFVIRPLTPLPALANAQASIAVDGGTQTAFAGDTNPFGPEIVIDGDGAGAAADGLLIVSSNHRVSNLNIRNFSLDGIRVEANASNNRISGNYIGTDSSGTIAMGNRNGVLIAGANNWVGGATIADRNVVSGNRDAGVNISGGGSNNKVQGNFFGLNAAGDARLANAVWDFIAHNGANGTLLGTDGDGQGDQGEGNIIAEVISFQANRDSVVAGNRIGTDATGQVTLGSGHVFVVASENLRIGTNADGRSDIQERNLISGTNTAVSILAGSEEITIAGNYIGTDLTGGVALAGGGHGIVFSDSSDVVIGGDTLAERNVIAAKQGFGIEVNWSNDVSIVGNYIGTNADGQAALGNQSAGIRLYHSSDVVVGGSGSGEGNLISGNRGHGISVGYSSGVSILGNLVGTDATGTSAIGNAGHGIEIIASSEIELGGPTQASGNIISASGHHGVVLANGSHDVTLRSNRIGTDITGTNDLGNFNSGVWIDDSREITIGGNGDGNVISGNQRGIYISGSDVETALYRWESSQGGNGHYYLVSPRSRWSDADQAARNLGGHLVSITSQAEGDFIEQTLRSESRYGQERLWIGLSDAATEGEFHWTSGEPFEYSAWGISQPDNYGDGGEDYGELEAGGAWNDFHPLDLKSAILEFVEPPTIADIEREFATRDIEILGNQIGTDVKGKLDLGNSGTGIEVFVGTNIRIGAAGAGDGNVISGNDGHGITLLNGASQVSIDGNVIGLDVSGTNVLGNDAGGITIEGASDVAIGSARSSSEPLPKELLFDNGDPNLVTRQRSDINGSFTPPNQVADDFILTGNDTTITSLRWWGTKPDGVSDFTIRLFSFEDVGGELQPRSVADHEFHLGEITGTDTRLVDNGNFAIYEYVATIPATQLVANQRYLLSIVRNAGGIGAWAWATSEANGSGWYDRDLDGDAWGYRTPYNFAFQLLGTNRASNVISGNSLWGVRIAGGSRDVSAGDNYIGTDRTGTVALGNGQDGIQIVDSRGIRLGGDGDGQAGGNLISGNAGHGVQLLSSQLEDNFYHWNAAEGGNGHYYVVTNWVSWDEAERVAESLGGQLLSITSEAEGDFVATSIRTPNRYTNDWFWLGLTDRASEGDFGWTSGEPFVYSNWMNGDPNDGETGNQDVAVLRDDGTWSDEWPFLVSRAVIEFASPPDVNALYRAIGTSAVEIIDNTIGLDSTGTKALGNSGSGIFASRVSQVTIGGNFGNVISGNQQHGIQIVDAPSDGNVIQGNYIGTDVTGTVNLGNAVRGIDIVQASHTLIGGTGSVAGNVVSGNGQDGIAIAGANTIGTTIQGNWIGVDATGFLAIPNGPTSFGAGISVRDGASQTQIGGTTAAARNVIAGNTGYEILVADINSGETTIQGNYVGTDVTGQVRLGAASYGISIDDAPNTLVGGTVAGARNVIIGNAYGIAAFGQNATGLKIQGNYVGLNATGTQSISTDLNDGIYVSTPGALIGGTVPGAGNVVSGNGDDGITADNATDVPILIQGNLIGTDGTGKFPLGNGDDGIELTEGTTIVGGTTSSARNVISSNREDGITIATGAKSGQIIQGNYIGTDVTGTLALGNLQHGINVFANAGGVTIGGAAAGAGNVIAASGVHGILLEASENLVQGNFIGTDATGVIALANQGDGIRARSASDNRIGGTAAGAGNLVLGNFGAGIKVIGPDVAGEAAASNNASFLFHRVAEAPSVPLNAESFVELSEVSSLRNESPVFWGRRASGQQGIFELRSGAVVVLVDTAMAIPGGIGNFTSFDPEFAIDNDQLVFVGHGSGGQLGLYELVDGVLNRVADRSSLFPGTTETLSQIAYPKIATGTRTEIAFQARTSSNRFGVLARVGGELAAVLTDASWDPLESTCRHASLSIL